MLTRRNAAWVCCRTNAQQVSAVQGCCNKAIDELHGGVLRLMGATVSATAYLQASLLTHQHLSGSSFAHKVRGRWRIPTILLLLLMRINGCLSVQCCAATLTLVAFHGRIPALVAARMDA